jgi:hypothetical protein
VGWPGGLHLKVPPRPSSINAVHQPRAIGFLFKSSYRKIQSYPSHADRIGRTDKSRPLNPNSATPQTNLTTHYELPCTPCHALRARPARPCVRFPRTDIPIATLFRAKLTNPPAEATPPTNTLSFTATFPPPSFHTISSPKPSFPSWLYQLVWSSAQRS